MTGKRAGVPDMLRPGLRIAGALAWGVALAIVGVVAWRNRETLVPYLAEADWRQMGWACLLYLGALELAVIGWIAIIRSFAPGVSGWSHVRIYLATLAARRLPGTIWYVGGRLVLYKQLGVSGAAVSIASSVEFLVSLVSGTLVGLALLPVGLSLSGPVFAASLVGALGGLLLLHPRVIGWTMRRLQRPLVGELTLAEVAVWLGIYLGVWLLGGMMLSRIVSAFRPLEVHEVWLSVGAWALSGSAGLLTIFLPSTFGATELTLTIFLSLLVPLPLAAAIAIFARILTTAFEIVVAIAVYFPLRHLRAGSPR